MNAMHILHIAPTPFFADRGCHIRIHGEIRALQAQGHEVTLVTYHLGRDVPGIDTRRSLRVPWYTKQDAGFSWHKFYLDALLTCTALHACLTRRPDVIHAHLHEGAAIGWLVRVLASLRRIPVVFDVQGSLTGELQSYGSLGGLRRILFLFDWAERLICKLPDFFVCSSEANAAFLREHCAVPEAKILVLREGVEEQCSSPEPDLRQRLGLDPDSPVVMFTGSLLAAKGIGHLLQAVPLVAAKRPDARFVLVGYPVDDCQKQVNQANLGQVVTLCGQVDYFQLFAYLALADVAVDPKVEGSGEGSGKIANYMGAGLPVVCFDTPANRAVLGENGVFARPGDSMDLAEKILDLLHDPDQARTIGTRNKERISAKYSWQVGGQTLIRIYDQLLGK
jgi:glycosyltransferase involved in cell wall biosynthesis